jgi:hypothetical protein
MLPDLTLKQKDLANYMSDISEECYSAGWMQNLEYVLWDALINGERKFGREIISRLNIENLKHFSDECNCWIYFDNEEEEIAMSLEKWQEKFKRVVAKKPEVLQS